MIDKSERNKLIFRGLGLMKDITVVLMKDEPSSQDKEDILEALRRYVILLTKALLS